MSELLRFENGESSKSQQDEEAARSDGRGGGGSHAAASPSFLVHKTNNVNAQLYRAQSLLAMWDFLVYKGRLGRTHVLLNKKGEASLVQVLPAPISCLSYSCRVY